MPDDESTSLLPSPSSAIPAVHGGQQDEADSFALRRRQRVTVLIFILIIFVNIPSLLQGGAQVQIFEDIYCDKYYHDNPSLAERHDGRSCKVDQVQANIAFLRGWRSFFNFLPGVMLCVPYGMLADRVGRKWILVMNQIAINLGSLWVYLICSFPDALPLRLIWLEGIVGLFGGGNIVATALIFVIISDVTPVAQTAVTFFRLGAASYLCFLISYSIAGKLMDLGVWLPYSIGLCSNLLTIPLTLALPETLRASRKSESRQTCHASSSTISDFGHQQQDEAPDGVTVEVTSSAKVLIRTFRSIAADFGFLQDPRILFLALSYPIREALNNLDELYFQYVPKRFGWTIARTNYIYAFQAAVAVMVLLVFLPGASSCIIRHFKFTTTQKDIFFARSGVCAYALGTLLVAVAPNTQVLFLAIAIQTCGSGMGGATRALVTNLVEPNQVARLYSLLGLVEAVSLMLSSPIEATLFNLGMKHESSLWLGLPWFLMSICLSMLAIAFWAVRLTR
ncbi:MAG: hypothetical protein M1819_004853 [Sarea resinae]|nr:MAG: hypothetical protein M1819_004853 [Sarea resinae]